MFSLRTIEWFGIQSVNDQTNTAPARTGSWIRLVYQLPRKESAHPRYWCRASQLLRVIRPDLWNEVRRLNDRQSEQALVSLLDQHSKALDLPAIVVAEQNLASPSEAHWVPLYESRTLSHALTTFAVLAKTTDGICSPQRAPSVSALYTPRIVKNRNQHESVWEVALWLGHGYADLVARALQSPANQLPLEALL